MDSALDVLKRDVERIERLLQLSPSEVEHLVGEDAQLLMQPAHSGERQRSYERVIVGCGERACCAHRLCTAYDALYDTPSLPSLDERSLMTKTL